MTTYVYKSTIRDYTGVYNSVEIDSATGASYSTDQVALNAFVPTYLDRYVNGVLSNTDLIRPNPLSISQQQIANNRALALRSGIAYEALNIEGGTGIVGVAATFTTLTPADSVASTGFLQLSSSGVHGLTTGATHAGKYVYVTWSGGTGVSGLYAIKSVDSTLIITLNTTSTGFAGMGTAVVTVVGTAVTMWSATVPAGILGADGEIQIDSLWSHTSSANNKTITVKLGATKIGRAHV